jgi:hypothetical protein
MIPFSCTIFSQVVIEVNGNSSRLSIYFQNVNRLRTMSSDPFKTVSENDYDVIVLLETGLVSSFHDEELFDPRYSVFKV